MYRICKKFEFSAAHHLSGLPYNHPCARPHGHNYTVEVELASMYLDEVGFLRDFGDLKAFKDFIDETLDHQDLNKVLTFNPTSELLAHYFWLFCRYHWEETVRVRVSETPKTWAVYESDKVYSPLPLVISLPPVLREFYTPVGLREEA